MSFSTAKKVAFLFFVASGALTGLERLGANPLMKGRDTGFEALPASPPEGPGLELHSDMGAAQCWLRLSLGSLDSSSGTPAFHAHLKNGRVLGTILEPTTGDAWSLSITDPDSNPSQRNLFTWPAGIPILLTATVQGGGVEQRLALTTRDWTVWLAEDARDSKIRALWRKVFFILTIVSLVATVVVEIVEKSKKEEKAEFTATGCIVRLIDGIGRGGGDESRTISALLHKIVLGRSSFEEALRSVNLEPGSKAANRVLLRGKNYLRTRLDGLIADLESYRARV